MSKPKTAKVDAYIARLTITIPLNGTTYDAAKAAVEAIKIALPNATVEIAGAGLQRIPAPIPKPADKANEMEIPEALRRKV